MCRSRIEHPAHKITVVIHKLAGEYMSRVKNDYPFGNLLASLRELAGLQQKDMVKKLKAYKPTLHENTYRNWESGNNLPGLRDIQEIAEILQLAGVEEDDTDKLFKALSQTPPKLWTVPYFHNPLFTGRKRVLQLLWERLAANYGVVPVQAVSGLGGIGKTQIAVEYAYRYRDTYRTVLWAHADSRNSLISSYVALANELNLPEKDAEKQDSIVEAVKHWLDTHIQWLLILDNADNVAVVHDFLPVSLQTGHIILTTRSQVHGSIAQGIEVDRLGEKESIVFLLKRAKKVESNTRFAQLQETDIADAKKVVNILDGLPLALDQAGAYIEETGCSVIDYLDHYRQQRGKLLQRRGKVGKKEHPESVALTLSLSFGKVKQSNQRALKLLQFCAFLSPDAIPEQFLLDGASHLIPELQTIAGNSVVLSELIEALRAYSLIQRHATAKMLSLHRLVQEVLRDEMEESEQRRWAEGAVRVVERVFPSPRDIARWQVCEQYLPHAQQCISFISQYHLTIPEAAEVLKRIGWYLTERGRYSEVEPTLQQAVVICEQQLGQEHPNTMTSTSTLAWFYQQQGRYAEAEPLYQRVLAIREQQLGPTHPDTATSLNNLAVLYSFQGRFVEAEHLHQRALAIREQQLGPFHPDTSTSLNNLAALYKEQGKYAEAEPLYQRALAICEQQPGPMYNTPHSLHNLAALYDAQGKYAEAEPLYQRALAIREQQLGPMHPDVADSLNNLAGLYQTQGKYAEAEPLYQRALTICEQQLGFMHASTAASLNNLARLYSAQGRYAEAESLHQRALAIREQQLGPLHASTAASLNNLAALYHVQGKYAEAEPLYRRALAIREQQLGPLHPDMAQGLNNLAALYRAQGKHAEAEPLYQRALAICKQQLGPMHPNTAHCLNNLADLYQTQGKYAEAEPLYQQALMINEQALGGAHSFTRSVLQNYASLLRELGREAEAHDLEARGSVAENRPEAER
jgi:tetratricopeptide (TPR) repeat protein/transcriptional regulator with XRE-family HTH domain